MEEWQRDLNREYAFEDELRPRVQDVCEEKGLKTDAVGLILTQLYSRTAGRAEKVTDEMIRQEIDGASSI